MPKATQTAATRDRFISAATRAFAERGFYGTSIAAIAEPLPFTKQALLHHFGTKEKLYGEVLKRISDRLMSEIEDARERSRDSRESFEEAVVQLYKSAIENRDDTRLLMRELLDNRRRAETARTWYLKPFLETLVDMLMSDSTINFRSRHAALSVVYQLLGASTYFAISEPTLTQMLGKKGYSLLHGEFEDQLRTLISARLKAVG